MAGVRRKLSAPLRELNEEIDRLLRFDADNQKNFSTPTGSAKKRSISKRQLHMLTESIYFSAFRAYENFLRDVFLLYCLEKKPRSGAKVSSYLKPKSFDHAELLIQSSMQVLDWNNPDQIIERAELYLDQGFPVKLPYTVNRGILQDMRTIRNHIAHNSAKSLRSYKNVLLKHYGVVPLIIPQPGEFLLQPDSANPGKYKLLIYLEFLKQISTDLT
jgi:hypothetical protein